MADAWFYLSDFITEGCCETLARVRKRRFDMCVRDSYS